MNSLVGKYYYYRTSSLHSHRHHPHRPIQIHPQLHLRQRQKEMKEEKDQVPILHYPFVNDQDPMSRSKFKYNSKTLLGLSLEG